MPTYPKYLRALGEATVDVVTESWELQGVVGSFDGTAEFLSDVTTVGTAAAIPGITQSVTATGVEYLTTAISEATALDLIGIGLAADVDALVVFINTGVPGTSRLGSWLDRRASSIPVVFVGDGDDVRVWFPGAYFMKGNG